MEVICTESVLKPGLTSTWVNSLYEIDQMSDEMLITARLSKNARKRMRIFEKFGKSYLDAKRAVIKENFRKKKFRMLEEEHRSQIITLHEASKVEITKTELEWKSYTEALFLPEVVVMDAAYPAVQLGPDRLIAIETAVMEAYDKIEEGGPQVRLVKCNHKSGYIIMTCADNVSAEWLAGIVPRLRPWNDAILKASIKDDVPKPFVCSTYVQNEYGRSVSVEKLLKRLKVSNNNLRTDLWTVLGNTPADSGQVWAFSMDPESTEELKKIDMSPYCGLGRLKFCAKDTDQVNACSAKDSNKPQSEMQLQEKDKLSNKREAESNSNPGDTSKSVRTTNANPWAGPSKRKV